MARLEKREILDVPPFWTKQERGQHLWCLLQDRGVDPSRFYTVEYFPYRHCWLLTQEKRVPEKKRSDQGPPSGQASESFYVRALAELRRTARSAFGAVAARSLHFARFGCKYELPAKPQEITPADLAQQLGGLGGNRPGVRFDNEGGWRAETVPD